MSLKKRRKKKSFFKRIKSLLSKEKPSEVVLFDERESKIVKSLSGFREINVSDLMVTRQEIFAFPIDIKKEEILREIQKHTYTRIPIYKDKLDNIIGFIHIKDILRNIDNDFHIKHIMRNVIFVPTPMKAVDLLVKMQCSHIHVAIVLDEYGGTEGLVTIVNIIEEIVGNIDDEHDQSADPALIKIADGKFEVEGRMQIDTLESTLNIKFNKTEDYDTIGGLINTLLGRIPEKGEVIESNDNITYEILEADERCIHKVLMNIKKYKLN